MFTKVKISCLLALAVALIIVTTNAIFTKTATFAENREPQQDIEVNIWETPEYKDYSQNTLDNIALEYEVEAEYLYYIAEVEKMFNLEPYELIALIAQESGFKPKTHMDGGSYSYSTTQMKMPTAKTAYMAITKYYKKDIPYPSHDLMAEDKYYTTILAGGYLKYLHDTYQDKYESYTAYHLGIGGRMAFFKKNGHFKSSYALRIAQLCSTFDQAKATI